MKICWFNEHRLGLVIDDHVLDVTTALQALPAPAYPALPGDLAIRHLATLKEAIGQVASNATVYPLEAVTLASPVANPGKIIGVPVNYQEHVAEAQADVATFTDRYQGSVLQQGLFLKATSSLIGCSSPVRLRMPERLSHHEIELAIIIGKTASHVSAADAFDYIAAYAIALDMTIRGPEDRSFRKSLDTYSVLGPWMVTHEEISDPQSLNMNLWVDGELKQSTNTAKMILPIAEQIAWASSFYTLHPGDIIMTGTCEGVGPIVHGSVMQAEIENIGSMVVNVIND